MMKQNKISVIIKWIIFLLVTFFILYLLTPFFANRKAKDYRYRTFQNMQENPDVWIMGTSVTEMGIIPNQLYEEYGITAFNLSVAMQQIDTTEFVLDSFLKDKTPRVLVLSTDAINILDKPTTNCVETMALREIKGNTCKKMEYLYHHFGFRFIEYVKFFIPTLLFHEDLVNNDIKDQRNDNIQQLYELYSKGYKFTDENNTVELADSTNINQLEMNSESIFYLEKIIKICNEKDIQIIFVEIPSEFDFSYSDFIEKRFDNCCYINFTQLRDQIGLTPQLDYYDTVHLNNSGARKVTSYLGNILNEEYELIDHRELNENTIWDITLNSKDQITFKNYQDDMWRQQLNQNGYPLDLYLK